MSNDSKGFERELFTRQILGQALPPTFRVGAGEVTDTDGTLSGQLDVVIENKKRTKNKLFFFVMKEVFVRVEGVACG